ncbi:MAG: DUF3404 domain-containing protein [Bacteriovoracaceae bacterium]|nr:DUF3404 domain-containing protein [Bacteriovoracaceae bacterium]
MRLYLTLILTLLAMAFGTGYFFLFVQGSYTATEQDIMEINKIKVEFQGKVDPTSIINFNSIYYNQSLFQLLDPIYVMPHSDHQNIDYESSDSCFKNIKSLLNRENFEKVWIWEEYRCGKRKSLPRDFVLEPPYIHPSGKSYAWLMYRRNIKPYNNRNWIIPHLPYFHVTELSSVKRMIGNLGGIYEILERFDSDALRAIAKGQGTILTRDFLLARLNYPSIFSIVEYRVYQRDSLDGFLKDSPYFLHNFSKGRSCFYKDGPLCWDYNVKHLFKLANKGSIAALILFFFLSLMVLKLLLAKIKTQRREDERRRLALQVLTHEFRTPITSMLLTMEKVNKHIEGLDDELQESFLRISSDVYRLQRLTETSRNYLRSKKSNKLVNFNFEYVPSLNLFAEDNLYTYLEEFSEDKFKFIPLEKDSNFCLDPYWVGICIKNIVNNAIDHGEFPIEVSLNLKNNNELEITVQDNGEVIFDDISEITQEFVKGNKSTGTGLGLNIVKNVISEMEGELRLEKNPTRFIIHVKNKKGVDNE